jgi:hypothetical protein
MGLDGANIQVDGGGSTCRLSAATTGNYAVLNLGAGASYLNTAAYIVCDNAANQIKLYSQTATPLLFGINGSEVARIDTSGRLGIGMTPTVPLSVLGPVYATGAIAAFRGPNSGPCGIDFTVAAGVVASIKFDNTTTLTGNANSIQISTGAGSISFANGVTELGRFDTGGNLLVGTASSSDRLVVNGNNGIRVSGISTGNRALYIPSGDILFDNPSARSEVRNDGNSSSELRLSGRGFVTVYTGGSGLGTGSERARIDSSGNLLLGTTTAQALLTIKGATQIIGTGSSTAGGSGPSSGKITKQASSSTSTNSVTVTGTGFSNAAWVNGVIKITAAGGTIYSSNQSGIFAVYSFQGLAGTAPRNFTLMGTAMTAGGSITISFASSTSETLVVTASMSDGNVPGTIPSQNMSMTVEVDYGYPFTLS